MTVVVLVETVVIAILGLLVCGLLRSHAEILRRLRELETGTARPEDGAPQRQPQPQPQAPSTSTVSNIMGTTLADEVVKVGVAGAKHDTLLAFLSSGCFTCQEFWDTFSRRSRLKVPGDARLVIVTKDPTEESPSRLRGLAPANHPTVMSSAAWEAYDVPVAPFFVYVDGPSGRVRAQGAAQDWAQVVDLWSKAVSSPAPSRRRDRHARADTELLNAGIRPGDARLYKEEP